MSKIYLPFPVTRDDTDYGVNYYTEKDVYLMLETARAEERIACAKDASEKIAYRIKQGFAAHGHAEAVKKVILKRGAP